MREKKYKAWPKFFYTSFVSVKKKDERLMDLWVKPGQQRAGNFCR
jgi:hypothetical protein